MSYKTFLLSAFFFFIKMSANSQQSAGHMQEPYRPQVHFSPAEHWINDPNGMLYYAGVYHLFYQYHPYSSVWGPMHWGHATSKDLIHWKQQPIALYPDSLGYIFSGSAVVDVTNSSGFAKKGKAPLIAIFTSHDPKKDNGPGLDRENQSIAYSLDSGKTWTKYAHNPVLKNPGIPDFRDPKVMWYAPNKQWIMTLATKDRISFYSSPDLKNWKKESEFGASLGEHAGVWECPDLFTLNDKGKPVWVLLVNVNPGGPNKGSATQYFTGTFDGHRFETADARTKWLDYGPDEYAGVSFSNTGNKKILMGWMSNWMYANEVPTTEWKNALTLPRELSLQHAGNEILIASKPVPAFGGIETSIIHFENVVVKTKTDPIKKGGLFSVPCRLQIELDTPADFSIVFSNDLGEQLLIGYDKKAHQYFIDRSAAGIHNFNKDFATRHTAPRFSSSNKMVLDIIMDRSSVELFADDGLTSLTSIFFPTKPYHQLQILADDLLVRKIVYAGLRSIWK
jgi:fructan beta-fructosidase